MTPSDVWMLYYHRKTCGCQLILLRKHGQLSITKHTASYALAICPWSAFLSWLFAKTFLLRSPFIFAELAMQYVLIKEGKTPGDRIYTCTLCKEYSSDRKASAQRHILTIHTPSKDVQCSKCGNFYKNRAVLLAHYRKNQCGKKSRKRRKPYPVWKCEKMPIIH